MTQIVFDHPAEGLAHPWTHRPLPTPDMHHRTPRRQGHHRTRANDKTLLRSVQEVTYRSFCRFPNPGGLQSQYPPPNSNPFAFPDFPSNPGYPSPSGPPPGQYPSPAGPPPSQYQPPPGPPGHNQWNQPPGPPMPPGYPGQQGQQGPGFPGSNVNRPGPHPSQGPPSIPGNRPINPPNSEFPKQGERYVIPIICVP